MHGWLFKDIDVVITDLLKVTNTIKGDLGNPSISLYCFLSLNNHED